MDKDMSMVMNAETNVQMYEDMNVGMDPERWTQR